MAAVYPVRLGTGDSGRGQHRPTRGHPRGSFHVLSSYDVLTSQEARPPLVIAASSPSADGPEPHLIISSRTDITIVDRGFKPVKRWKAWDGNGRATALLETGGLLLGIGEDDTSRYPVLKVWDLAREDKKKPETGPVLLRNVRIQHGQRPHPVGSPFQFLTLGIA